MTLTITIIYILLALGIILVVLAIAVIARQLFASSGGKSSTGGAHAPYLAVLVLVIGIASLGTSGFISVKKSDNTAAPQAQASTPVASASAAGPAEASTLPATPPAPSTSAAPTGAVTVDSPASGSKVQGCDVFTGTSDLAAGQTIVLSVRNLNDSGTTSYLAPVQGYDKPAALAKWTGVQYFGSGDNSVGQTYLVSVLVMASSAVKSALAEPANRTTWAVTSLPSGSTVKDTLHLTRISGPGPQSCS